MLAVISSYWVAELINFVAEVELAKIAFQKIVQP